MQYVDPVALHITTSTTTTPVAQDVILTFIAVVVSNAGTSWTFKVQDKGGTAKIIVPQQTLALPSGLSPNLVLSAPIVNFPQSGSANIPLVLGGILATGGIDIITSGTAGVVDVYLSYVLK